MIDPSIPLQAKQPNFIGPQDIISLRDLVTRAKMNQGQLQDQERGRQQEMDVEGILKQPGMLDQQTGALTPEGIASVTQRSPMQGQKFAQQRMVTLGQLAQQQQGNIQLQVNQMQLAAKQKELRDNIGQKAVNAFDLAIQKNTPPDEARRIYRQTIMDGLDELERSGMAKAAGMTDEAIMQLRTNVPEPDQLRSGLMSLKDITGNIEKQRDDKRKDEAALRDEKRLVISDKKADAALNRPDPVTTVQIADPKDPNKAIVIDARTGKKVGDAPPPKEVAEKALPSSAAQKLFENQQNMRKAQVALEKIQGQGAGADPDATGLKGYLPDSILQRTDPKGVETRAAIADLGSMIIHDRSGAAVTASEYPRLKPFIPTVTDDAATIEKKLKRFVQVYGEIVSDASEFYRESGYKVPEMKSSGKGMTDVSGAIVKPMKKPGTDSGKGLQWTDADQKRLDELEKKHGK